MTMVRATKTAMGSLTRSMDLQGRMPRKTFWQFYLVWQPIALLITWVFAPGADDGFFYLKLYCLYAIAMIPLWGAGAQRLQDVGQSGHQILYPLAPFGILFFCIYGMFFLFAGGTTALLGTGDDGAAFLGATLGAFGAAFGVLFYLLFIPCVLIAALTTCMLASHLMGQCMLPSDPNTNSYGPNPHEVTQ